MINQYQSSSQSENNDVKFQRISEGVKINRKYEKPVKDKAFMENPPATAQG